MVCAFPNGGHFGDAVQQLLSNPADYGAIVLSVAGVMIGLMIRGEPFGIVMSGMGVIALAGIVVNNNIILIDTCNILIEEGMEPVEAALRTGAQRLRPRCSPPLPQ